MTTILPDWSAYSLKYYAEVKSQIGDYARLEIYSKSAVDASVYPLKIGDFRSLKLQVGTNGAIDDPITKSTLTFSMVDSFHKGIANGVKHGNWQEFYTPDSTEYLVMLKTGTDGSSYTLRWCGYITPDSWEEGLDAYSDVTITARDNIGHLSDFDFDYTSDDGLITVYDLISFAMAKIAMPMTVRLMTDTEGSSRSVKGGDVDLMSASMNVSAFEGGTWYSALEKVLSSLGLVMRYMDDGAIVVTYIANLPLMGETTYPVSKDVIFLNGNRSLDPAYKEIVTETDYGAQEEIEDDSRVGLVFGDTISTFQYRLHYIDNSSGVDTGEVGTSRYTPLIAGGKWSVESVFDDRSGIALSDDVMEKEGESATDYLLVPTNADEDNGVYISQELTLADIPNTGIEIAIPFVESVTVNANLKLAYAGLVLSAVRYRIRGIVGSIIYYWNGEVWGNLDESITEDLGNAATADLAISLPAMPSVSPDCTIVVTLEHIECKCINDVDYFPRAPYARMDKLRLSVKSSMLESNKVTTINNESYNIRADRSAEIGPLSRTVAFITPQSYVNALWYKSDAGEVSQFPYDVHFDDEVDNTFPLPVLIHKQMLMFHHVAMEVLTGECLTTKPMRFDNRYAYKGVDYLVQSGTLNLLTGRMESVTLRQYIAYEDI